MTISRYLLTMSFATLIAWIAFLLVLFNVDPYDGGTIGRSLFYSALFFCIFGTLSIIGFIIRVWLKKGVPLYWHVLNSFRQAIIISILIVASLVLQASRLLTIWNIVLFILAATLLEFFFISRVATGKRR